MQTQRIGKFVPMSVNVAQLSTHSIKPWLAPEADGSSSVTPLSNSTLCGPPAVACFYINAVVYTSCHLQDQDHLGGLNVHQCVLGDPRVCICMVLRYSWYPGSDTSP